MPVPKDPIKLAEWTRKQSESHKGHIVLEETKKKISLWHKGKKRPAEVGAKIREKKLGHKVSEETRKKLSLASKGRKWKNESLQKRSLSQSGEKHYNWKGGISFEPYCILFNNDFKNRCRAFFDNICIECGTPENGKKHSVHHINYNKEMCCNDDKPLFICLCRKCNSKVNYNRDWWEKYFTNMINGYYGGKCYLTKEEYNARFGILA